MSDQHPNALKPDLLGYDHYADALWQRIEGALYRDTGKSGTTGAQGALGDDPLVVGIFGEWGAGKSDLLGRLHERAKTYQDKRCVLRTNDDGFGLTIPVMFHPWKYEHEKHLHVPLLLTIRDAFKEGLKEGQTRWEGLLQAAQKPGDQLVGLLPQVVKQLDRALAATTVAMDPATAATVKTGLTAVKGLSALLGWLKQSKVAGWAGFHPREDGRYFHELHKVLKAITRPGQGAGKDYLDGIVVNNSRVAINFVVFVDDLDRCLPEKAVEVLELIKTIFNVESFAFVLALDDEIIERGIGHRYKEYQLVGKKPEMPITGFEYLEKIVHLPFRLPALTAQDALKFLEKKEEELLDLQKLGTAHSTAWFSLKGVTPTPRHGAQADSEISTEAQAKSTTEIKPTSDVLTLHLGHLVINSFDAYVPRKLARVVELFHQVAALAEQRGRALDVTLSGGWDPRLVLALVLLQLFQPELYRCLRRTGGFDSLKQSFRDGNLSYDFSDMDLLHWACYGPDNAKKNSDPAGVSSKDETPPPVTVKGATLSISKLIREQRHGAQNVRLPVVQCLLEHRAAQRHVFDPLKLFAQLQASHLRQALPDSIKKYYSLLAKTEVDGLVLSVLNLEMTATVADVLVLDDSMSEIQLQTSEAHDTSTHQTVTPKSQEKPTVPVEVAVPLADPIAVFNALISPEESLQAEVVARAQLRPGQVINAASAKRLHSDLVKWLAEHQQRFGNTTRAQHQLLRGLLLLGPYLRPHGDLFWPLVQSAATYPLEPNTAVPDPVLAALYTDVQALLGQDKRFEPDRPWVMTQRFEGHTAADEPIPGFVRIPAGPFKTGDNGEKKNSARDNTTIDQPFYIARCLTTVEQYKRFVEVQGYQPDPTIWDAAGRAWLQLVDREKKSRSNKQATLQNLYPHEWKEQQAYTTRPVVAVAWHEARAYARWLNVQMKVEIADRLPLGGYGIHLPTELQWERAARASSLNGIHAHPWPWGEQDNVAQRANIRDSGIGHVSSVGSFAPNPIGLCDVVGNAWQWMDNGFEPEDLRMNTRVEFDKDVPSQIAKRGGSYVFNSAVAACSSRSGFPTDSDYYGAGFRVVLALTQLELTENNKASALGRRKKT